MVAIDRLGQEWRAEKSRRSTRSFDLNASTDSLQVLEREPVRRRLYRQTNLTSLERNETFPNRIIDSESEREKLKTTRLEF